MQIITGTKSRDRVQARSWATALVLGAALWGAAGCDLSAGLRDKDSRWKMGGAGCTSEDCGANSAHVNGYPVDELHLQQASAPPRGLLSARSGEDARLLQPGLPNVAGVRVTGFRLGNGLSATLFAENGVLRAVRLGNKYYGDDLVGGRILIERGPIPDEILIAGYERIDGNPGTLPVHRYLFEYVPDPALGGGSPSAPPFPPVSVCKIAADTGRADLTWAVILTRERYMHSAAHEVLPEVFDPSADGWFNIACQGTASFKMDAWAYRPDLPTTHGSWTSPHSRDAVLRSIVNDACGLNMSFTETGTQVAWYDGRWYGGNEFVSRPPEWDWEDMEVESIWTADGPWCLTKPREPVGVDVLNEVSTYCAALLQQPCPSVEDARDNLEDYGVIMTLVEKQP